MNIEKLAREYLADLHVMQLATSQDDQPHVCNVHFLADENLNLYWLSVPNCQHSEDIAANPKAAVCMVVSEQMPLIGVQIEGDAQQLEFTGNAVVLEKYAARHNRKTLVEDALAGRVPFKLYQLKPRVVSVFDLKNFPKSPKQIVEV